MATPQNSNVLATATNLFTYLNNRQYDLLPNVLHSSFQKHFPPHLGKASSDTKAFVDEYKGLVSQFPEVKSRIERSIVSEKGDEVWLWTKVEGLPEGFDMEIVEICRLEDGKIREKWDVHQTGRQQ